MHTPTTLTNNLPSKANLSESKSWLSRLNRIFDKAPIASSLKNDLLAQKLFVSERQLNRKVKTIENPALHLIHRPE